MSNQWDPDVALDDALAFDLIDTQFRELSPAPMELIGRGWDNAVYRFGDWVFRFPLRASAAPLIETELALLPELAESLPLPIPNPILRGEPATGYPYPWLGYKYLEGSPACALPPTQSAPEQIAGFLTTLHNIEVTAPVPPDEWDRADLRVRMTYVEERLRRLTDGGLVEEPHRILAAAEDLTGAAPAAAAGAVVHGDLYPCHVLVTPHRIGGIIDWGDVHRGDPALDLSIGYSWFDERQRRRFFDAYGGIDVDTDRRARFRSLHYGLLLLEYGTTEGRPDIVVCARRALAGAIGPGEAL